MSSNGLLVAIDCWRALQHLGSISSVQYVGLGIGVAQEESAAEGAAQ